MQTFFFGRASYAVSLMLLTASQVLGAAPNQLTEEEKAGGWKLLFDGKTTSGWHSFKTHTFPEKGWFVEGGWLHGLGRGGGNILSDDEFDQFELQWEWKQVPKGNSGLKYFVLESRNECLGHEYQMLDDENEPESKKYDRHATGSFYDVLKPTLKVSAKPAGEINESRVVVKGNRVEHWLNGKKVLEYSCGSEEVKAAVAASKFKRIDHFGERLKGHILLQEHGSPVWFRNVKIRDLETRNPKSE